MFVIPRDQGDLYLIVSFGALRSKGLSVSYSSRSQYFRAGRMILFWRRNQLSSAKAMLLFAYLLRLSDLLVLEGFHIEGW